MKLEMKAGRDHPPIPTVKARSDQFLPSVIGSSRPRKEPGPSRISCECPWSWSWKCPSWSWSLVWSSIFRRRVLNIK
jgi:hypothetical protein